jgi:hypothetical protein
MVKLPPTTDSGLVTDSSGLVKVVFHANMDVAALPPESVMLVSQVSCNLLMENPVSHP